LWATYLPSSVYAEYLAKENLMTPLMLGVAWCALRFVKTGSFGIALGCGILFGLLAITGNAALSLALPAAVALALAPVDVGRKVSAAALASIVAIGIATPWMIRNHQELGASVLNTNGGFNLYLGNNPAATGYFVSISETPHGSTWDVLRKEGEVQASETLRRDAIDWIKNNPSKFLVLAFKKAVLFWTPPVHEGKGQVSNVERVIRMLWLIQFTLITFGAIAALSVPSLRTRYTTVLWVAIASYTAVHMLFYVIFRYREPIMPFVCVMAALAFEYLLTRLSMDHKAPVRG
jgi:hypothetical protein